MALNKFCAIMEPRLNFYKSGPDAMKAMTGLEQQIAGSGLEKSLMELVRLRASQIKRYGDDFVGKALY